MQIKIERFLKGNNCLIGKVYINDEFFCYSLEREWLDNRKYISCIPQGKYQCKPYSSDKYPDVVEIINIKNRSKILIHKGNYYWEIAGCILFGDSYAEEIEAYNKHTKQKELTGAVWNSVRTLKKFYRKVGYEFDIEIINNYKEVKKVSFIGKLFGTEKALNTVVSSVKNSLDSLVYTEEEKAQHAAKERSEARSMVVKWMEATQGQNLARRLIALMVAVTWLMQYLIMMLLSIISVWVEDSEKLNNSAKLIGEYTESMNGAMMLILAFYFAAPHMGSMLGGALNKFGKTPSIKK